jgi:ABC-type cobalamin transport system permease subunit
VLVCCAVLVAAQVAVSGSIAWVGLVIPHLARLLAGADHRRLLPTAFWLGGGFMIVVDDLARTLIQAEIPMDHHRAAWRAAVHLAAGAVATHRRADDPSTVKNLLYGHSHRLFAR